MHCPLFLSFHYDKSVVLGFFGPVLFFIFATNEKVHEQAMTFLWVSVYERLKPKAEESTRLTHTVLFGELEYLKIETRLIDEMFASVMGEYVFLKW